MIDPDKSFEGLYSYCPECGTEIWRWSEDARIDSEGTIMCSDQCQMSAWGIKPVNWDETLGDDYDMESDW